MYCVRPSLLVVLLLIAALSYQSFAQQLDSDDGHEPALVTILLADGAVYVGTVTEELEDRLTLRLDQTYRRRTITIWIDEIIGRSPAPNAEKGAEDAVSVNELVEEDGAEKNIARLFVIPIEGGVGQYCTLECVKMAVESVDLNEIDAIVLKLRCSDAFVFEVMRIHEYLLEIGRQTPVIAWVHLSSNGSAGLLALGRPDRYMASDGQIRFQSVGFGSWGWGELDPRSTDEVSLWWRHYVEDQICTAGIDPCLAEAMLDDRIMLSVDGGNDPNSVLVYRNDLFGEWVLSRGRDEVYLTSASAEALRVSKGTADTLEELAKLRGYDGYVEVSTAGREIADAWLNLMKEAERSVPRLHRSLAIYKTDSVTDVRERVRAYRLLVRYTEMLGPEVAAIFFGVERDKLMEAFEKEAEKRQ